MYFTHTYTTYRTNFNMTKDEVFKSNNTIPALESQYVGGQNFWYNETQEIAFIVNGKGKATPMSGVKFGLNAYPEVDEDDIDELDDSLPDEDFERFWSDATNWPDGNLPKAGEDVEIKPQWNMVLDIAEPPVFRLIKVFGRLSFSDTMDIHLQCKHISIRDG